MDHTALVYTTIKHDYTVLEKNGDIMKIVRTEIEISGLPSPFWTREGLSVCSSVPGRECRYLLGTGSSER